VARQTSHKAGHVSVISETDIWRAANLLIREHGKDAELAAARRADEMVDRGDIEGQQVWFTDQPRDWGVKAPATGRPN